MVAIAAAAEEIIAAAGAPIPPNLPPPATDTDMETSSQIFCDIFAYFTILHDFQLENV